ncbi:MAG: 50S ribosomal protein L11 methyltransferase, partial [Bacteroidia bacterium]|nr:50S ribosomal protein L11 methyltransferase [Bacteroidia bacterium]
MSDAVYLAYRFTVEPVQPVSDILVAELGYAGFESFVETETGVIAYIRKIEWHPSILEDIQILNSEEFSITYAQEEIEQINWNQEWEKNFKPIVVEDLCT